MIEIKLLDRFNLKGFTFLEGFPGAGLVGPMAISYIIEKQKMQYIGSIESDDFPPLIAIHGDKPMPPIRLYMNDKMKIMTVLAEFAIPLELTYELSKKMYNFLDTNGIAKIVSINGIPASQQDIEGGVVFAIASNDTLLKEAAKAGMKPVGEGVSTGVSALMMLFSTQSKMADINVLIPVNPAILDPKYAELAIASLNKLLKLNVDIEELDKEAKTVESKLRDLLKRSKDMQDAHKRAIDQAGPPTYA